MIPPSQNSPPALELARRIDAVCNRFEAAWRSGTPPCIQDFLDGWSGEDLLALLDELVLLDKDYRRGVGLAFCTPDDQAAVSSPAAMQVTLTAISGPHTGQTFTFTGHDRFLVGRSARAHFRLQPGKEKDLYVSRTHFLIEVNPPLCCIHDMDSRNGTWVNGKRIRRTPLKHGDQVRAGHTLLRVDIEAPQAAPTGEWSGILHKEIAPPGGESPAVLAPEPAAASGCPACRQEPDSAPVVLCAACRQQASGQAQPIPGYTLLRELGRGGMGVVYLAWRAANQGLAAVKTITPEVTPRPGLIERFLREANILRQLDHPQIVPFYEMGAADKLLFFSMEYVRGTDAERLLRARGPLPVATAVGLVCAALEALQYAHALGFVHRDIKPANLLIGTAPEGPVKLADFGLARVYQASQLSGLTLPEDVGGTIGFMPPEQITHYRDAQPPADQYAAAATLYYLLTGHYPHNPASNVAVQLARILKEAPVPILARRSDLPRGLARVIHRALARRPADRYPDAAAFRLALLPFAHESQRADV